MKFEKQSLKINLIFLGIFLGGLLLGASFVYVLAASPSSTHTISSGIYPGAPSFTVWVESGSYFAKDANGLWMSSFDSSNFTSLIKSCIDALPTAGGKILLKTGYYVGWVVIGRDGVFLAGEGCWATQGNLQAEPPPSALYGSVIKPPAGKNGIEISGWTTKDSDTPGSWKYGIQIRDLGIWFTSASTGHGITTGMPYNKTTVTNLVVENIKILNNDKNHYGLQLCNFLYSTFKNIMVWGGPMLEIFSNSEWLQQGNSVFDHLFNRINYDLESIQDAGPFPIFIHRNSSIPEGIPMLALSSFRRIQVNNPIGQTGDYPSLVYWQCYLGDIRYTTFELLNLEGVNDNLVIIGSSQHLTFLNALLWTMDPGNAYVAVASNTQYILWQNCFLENILDGNHTNVYQNCAVYGTIDSNTQASFINLLNNSGIATFTAAQTSVTVGCKFIGPNDYVLLTVNDADTLDAGESLKVSTINRAPTNTFIIQCGDELAINSTITFYWQIVHATP